MDIRWKKGYRSVGDAEKIYNEVEKIRKRDGDVTPEAVVARAKSPRNPLHKEIIREGGDEAAEQWWLYRARNMLRSIEVVRPEAPTVQSRAYEVTTKATDNPEKPVRMVYQDTAEILQDPIARDELLGRAIREAVAFRKRYHALQELSQVFTALDDFLVRADI